MRVLYSIGWLLATPLVVGYLLWRSRRQPEYRTHWAERFGLQPRRADPGPLIWIHAVSVGETRAAQPLVSALAAAYPQARILITAMTPTGRETARELYAKPLGTRFAQAYLPYDYAGAPRRFLRAWRPSIGLVMETELWPNLMAAAEREGVPVALVNARLSARSLARGERTRALVAPAARRLAAVLAQSPADAERIASLGREADAVTGNLKFDNAPKAALLALGAGWRARIGRPVLVAASTRDGEEPLLWDAWRRALGTPAGAAPVRPEAGPAGAAPRPLLAIVPRHPQRFGEVARDAAAAGFVVARRAALDDPAFDWSGVDLLLGDSMGEMDAWYALAGCAVIGGSLKPFGSQNLIEACAAGCPVLVGPSTFNFAEAAAQAIEEGAARPVADADAAIAEGLRLLADGEAARAMGAAGARFAATHRGATRRTLDALGPLLRRTLGAPAATPQEG
ncbi:MAG: lipid IV(A) 3-deoxy-D-manno-octulosonic acid transferase [Burkholderiaceae bacterium]|nr:lipid IV(A) 3-deoxy-D-manno-octulosonic acid transferase [Burkholderiales bacterium]MCZ8337177.1 lipid IV(A) 3-deoxy-D-manno-octulosonic acid transferase [Burkholderiaceae bacterium]